MPPTTPPTPPSVTNNDLLSTQIELMQRMNTLLEQQYDRLSAIQGALEGQVGMTRQAQQAADDYSSSADAMSSSSDRVTQSLQSTQGAFDSFTGAIKGFIGDEAFGKITSGFSEGFKLLGINIDSLTSSITNPLSAIFGMGMGVWSMIVQKAEEVRQKMLQLAESLERVREKFGSFNENTSRRTLTVYRELGSTLKTTQANASQFAAKFPLDPFEAAEKRLDIAMGLTEDLGSVFDILGQQFNDAADNLFLLKEGLNFSAEALKQTAVLSQLSGKSLKQFSGEIMASVNKIGKQFGISTKVLGQDVGKALSNFRLLGRMTGDYVKEMTKAAVFTRKLGIEITELTGLVDKFDEFEGGAEAAAQLAQGFGMVLDPLKMMGMEVGPRLQEMQRAFMATGRSIESMSRQERKLLADTAGLTEQQALLAFSSKGMSMSYDEISAGAEVASKKQKTMEEVMGDVLDNIPNIIKDLGPFLGFVDAFFKGLSAGFGQKLLPTLTKLAESLGKVASIGARIGVSIFEKLFPPGKEDGTITFLVKIGQMFVDIATKVETFMNALFGDGDVIGATKDLLGGIFDAIANTFSFDGGGMSKMIDKVGSTLLQILVGSVEWLADQIPKWTQSLSEVFTDAATGEGGAKSPFEGLVDKLTDAAGRVLENLPDLSAALFGAVTRMFKRFPWVSLFVAGGPIATALGGIATGFYSMLSNLFSGTGAAAAGAPAVQAEQFNAAKAAGEAAGSTVTEGATAVVQGSQGLLDRLFDLIEEPAKIGLMATVISSAIVQLGNAVREVFLSFMDPLPGRDDNKSFIDVVVDSAKKFKDVELGDMLMLGGVLGAVAVGIGGLLAGIMMMSSKLSPGQLAAAAAGGLIASAVGAAGGGLVGKFLGGVGDLIQDIVLPFTNAQFITGLKLMTALKDDFLNLPAVADSLKMVIGSVVDMQNALPTSGIIFKSADTKVLSASIDSVLKFLAGNPDGETDVEKRGLIGSLNTLTIDTAIAGKAAGIIAVSSVVTSIKTLATSIRDLGNLDDAKGIILKLTGDAGASNGFLSYMSVIPGWINATTTTNVDAGAAAKFDAMVPVFKSLGLVAKTLMAIDFGGGGFLGLGGGAASQADKLVEFLPKMTSSVNSMSDQIPQMKLMEKDRAIGVADGIDAMFMGIDRYAAAVERTTTNLSQRKLNEFERRVTAIVNHVGKVRQILEGMGTMTLDATLDKFGKDLSVAKQTFSIAGGAVNVHVKLNVTMNAEKMSQALVMGGYVKPTTEYSKMLQEDYKSDSDIDGLTDTQRDSLAKGILPEAGDKNNRLRGLG